LLNRCPAARRDALAAAAEALEEIRSVAMAEAVAAPDCEGSSARATGCGDSSGCGAAPRTEDDDGMAPTRLLLPLEADAPTPLAAFAAAAELSALEAAAAESASAASAVWRACCCWR
jgi:hypothetical protein